MRLLKCDVCGLETEDMAGQVLMLKTDKVNHHLYAAGISEVCWPCRPKLDKVYAEAQEVGDQVLIAYYLEEIEKLR